MNWKPYPAYKDCGVGWSGEIPTHWKERKLKYVASVVVSNVDKHSTDGENPVHLCNYLNVYNNDFIGPDIDLMEATASLDEIAKFKITKGDVLVTKDSEDWRDIAVSAYVTSDMDGVLCGYHLAQIRPTTAIIDGKYLFRAFSASGINDQFKVAATGITRYGLGKYSLDSALFPVPPLDEQRAIAAFLDRETERIDTLIAKKQRQIELLQEKRSALISHAVTKGLDSNVKMKDSGVEWLGQIPEHWGTRRLRYVGKAILGLTYQPSDVVDETQGTLVLRSSNIQNRSISLQDNVYVRTEVPQKLLTRIGDILICSRNGSRALIGKNAKILPSVVGKTFGAFMTVFRSNISDYLYYVFNSQLFEYQSGLFLTSTINQLTVDNLYNFEVPLPTVEEQLAIVAYLNRETDRLDMLIVKVETTMGYLREYRSTLISAAVTGKIDIRNEASV